MTAIKLKDAKFCFNCEVIFTGYNCPVCGRDDNWVWLVNWIAVLIEDAEQGKHLLSNSFSFN